MIPLGIFAKTYVRGDVTAVLNTVSEAGFDCTQFNMSCAGLDPLPAVIPTRVAASIRAAFAETGVAPSALSGTYNMIHPDPSRRAAEQGWLLGLIEAAPAMGFSLVTLCTGTCNAHDPWTAHPDNDTPEAWASLAHELELILPVAERCGVMLGVEPETGNVVRSPAHAARLLADLGSRHLGVVIDPANLDEYPTRQGLRDKLALAFDQIGDRIVLAHAKDRTERGQACAAGKGAVDFMQFLRLLDHAGYAGPLVLHGLDETEVAGAVAHLRACGGYDQ